MTDDMRELLPDAHRRAARFFAAMQDDRFEPAPSLPQEAHGGGQSHSLREAIAVRM